MNTYFYDVDGMQLTMPESTDFAPWVEFFTQLVQVDPFAPMYSLLHFCDFLYNLPIELPPMPHEELFYDVGIALAAEDEYPASKAAARTGFYAKGVMQLMTTIKLSPNLAGAHASALGVIIHKLNPAVMGIGANDVRDAAMLIEWYDKKVLSRSCFDIPGRWDYYGWVTFLEDEMANDPCASTSVLSYYLRPSNGDHDCVFCPYGDERYCVIGELMHSNRVVMRAAIRSGLMATAVPIYFDTALDAIDNWRSLEGGIRFLLKSKKLRDFIPFEARTVAEALLSAFPNGVEDESADEWCELNHKLLADLRSGRTQRLLSPAYHRRVIDKVPERR